MCASLGCPPSAAPCGDYRRISLTLHSFRLLISTFVLLCAAGGGRPHLKAFPPPTAPQPQGGVCVCVTRPAFCFDSGVIISIMLMKMSFVPLFLSSRCRCRCCFSFACALAPSFLLFMFPSESIKIMFQFGTLCAGLSFAVCQSQTFWNIFRSPIKVGPSWAI